jgi:sirohydrochlorin cobaltochelatase
VIPEKTALILFAHGARDARWAQPLARLRAELVRLRPQMRIEVAFLDLQAPGLPETLAGIAADGIAHIHVAPVFWSMGGHIATDLPALIDAFRTQHPGTRVEVLPVLAELPGMNDFLARAMLSLARLPLPG